MTYFGMWRSFFGWHKEDADLQSVNFLHWGAPKHWYCISPKDQAKFDRMAQVWGWLVDRMAQVWGLERSGFDRMAQVWGLGRSGFDRMAQVWDLERPGFDWLDLTMRRYGPYVIPGFNFLLPCSRACSPELPPPRSLKPELPPPHLLTLNPHRRACSPSYIRHALPSSATRTSCYRPRCCATTESRTWR